jgi:hypothetical protein
LALALLMLLSPVLRWLFSSKVWERLKPVEGTLRVPRDKSGSK